MQRPPIANDVVGRIGNVVARVYRFDRLAVAIVVLSCIPQPQHQAARRAADSSYLSYVKQLGFTRRIATPNGILF